MRRCRSTCPCLRCGLVSGLVSGLVAPARAGFTLIELVVVLLILAVLTLVAVQSTENLVEQAHFEVTQRTLDNLQSAVAGDPAQGEAVASFMADMGRAPVVLNLPAEARLGELWTPPTNPFMLFQARTAPSDADVRLLAGWRGPYLRLGVQLGSTRLLDGWGKPFDLLKADATVAQPGDAVAAVRSNGGFASPYNAAMTTSAPWVVPTATITGSVQDTDVTTPEKNDVTVRLFYPDLAEASGVKEATATATQGAGYTFSFVNVRAGTVALRAYQDTRKSSVMYLRVPPGGLTKTISFDIR